MSSGFSVNLSPVIADLTAAQNAIAGQLIGVGQGWQDVTASRAINTAYQNLTGRPIQIAVSVDSASQEQMDVSPDGVTWTGVLYTGGQGSDSLRAQPIIPAGWHYRCTVPSGTVQMWAELVHTGAPVAELPGLTTLSQAQLETLIAAYVDSLDLSGGGGGGDGLGVGQTWTLETGSRSAGVTYQNTLSRSIAVSIIGQSSSFSDYLRIGPTSPIPNSGNIAQPNPRNTFFGIVPPSHYYELTGGTIIGWSELK